MSLRFLIAALCLAAVQACSFDGDSIYNRCLFMDCYSDLNCASSDCVGFSAYNYGYCAPETYQLVLLILVPLTCLISCIACCVCCCRRRKLKTQLVYINQAPSGVQQ